MIRILLAEDDESMRAYLARALERTGYEVVSVATGAQAVPHIDRDRFDLLLTDLVMSEMDGSALFQHAAVVAPDLRNMFITDFDVLKNVVAGSRYSDSVTVGSRDTMKTKKTTKDN